VKHDWGTEPLFRDADTTTSRIPKACGVRGSIGDTPRQASNLTEIWPGWMVDDYDSPVGEGLDRMTDIARHNRN
jgi:hypothetical protein